MNFPFFEPMLFSEADKFRLRIFEGDKLLGGVSSEWHLDSGQHLERACSAQFVDRNEQRELRHDRVLAGTAHRLFAAYTKLSKNVPTNGRHHFTRNRWPILVRNLCHSKEETANGRS
jgi:hypothetical protein